MAPDDSMQSRVPGSRLKLHVLLNADRWVIAAAILVIVYLVLVALVWLDPVSLGSAMATTDPVESLFQALVTAIITGVTLVVSINSLVISQELGAVGDQRDRMEGSLDFRDDVAEMLDDSVSPPEPAAFLRAMLTRTSDRARDFADGVEDLEDDELRERVESYVDDLVDNADEVASELEGSRFGTFDVLSAALDFNYSLKIQNGRRLQRNHAGAFDEEATAALDDVLTALEQYGPAREHIKTLYFQWELVDLSRAILYAAVPALIVSIGALLTLNNPGSIGGATLGIANVSWVIVGAATLALAPFAILLAYILRIATVAKRTLAIGPFVLRTTERADRADE